MCVGDQGRGAANHLHLRLRDKAFWTRVIDSCHDEKQKQVRSCPVPVSIRSSQRCKALVETIAVCPTKLILFLRPLPPYLYIIQGNRWSDVVIKFRQMFNRISSKQ